MFTWRKRGLVFDTARHAADGWMRCAALTPTPHLITNDVMRVYAGFRDADGVSRIGFVDVRADDPTQVVRISRKPVLDIGRDGCFDDNGVILGDIVATAAGVWMFYVGFQRVAKAKFLAFTGLALSRDGGDTFARVQDTPILDRAPGRSTIAAIHSAAYADGCWRLWYAVGDDWQTIGGKPFPRYHIRSVQTQDLHNIPREDTVCLRPSGDEYRIGRPRVYRVGAKYLMHFTRGTTGGAYTAGAASSDDGVHWTRADSLFGLTPSPSGWDSRALCYPALCAHRGKVWMFYNGNDMGADGFGVAEAVGTLDPSA